MVFSSGYVNDEPESKFLYTETVKLYCHVFQQVLSCKMCVSELSRCLLLRSCKVGEWAFYGSVSLLSNVQLQRTLHSSVWWLMARTTYLIRSKKGGAGFYLSVLNLGYNESCPLCFCSSVDFLGVFYLLWHTRKPRLVSTNMYLQIV